MHVLYHICKVYFATTKFWLVFRFDIINENAKQETFARFKHGASLHASECDVDRAN